MLHPSNDGASHCAPYPLFVRLQGEPVVVVGGGAVAEHKVESLLEHGADITVVSPEATEAIRRWAGQGRIEWLARSYEPDDLDSSLLAVCAAGESLVDEAVYAEASRRRQLVNVVDVPGLCNAFVPSTLRRGRLQIAVSTDGASPSTAREIRRSLEESFPEWWADYLDLLAEVRLLVKERVPGPAWLRMPLHEAVRESDVRERVATGEQVDAEAVYAQVVEPLLESLEGGRT